MNTFTSTWYGFGALTDFPLINTSKITKFKYAWANCISLTEFPFLDSSNCEDFSYAWYNCKSIRNLPLLNLSNGVDFNCTWHSCENLLHFPLLDLSSGTKFAYSWAFCQSLLSFPNLNLSHGNTFCAAWSNCYNLMDFPPNMFDNVARPLLNNCFTDSWAECNLSLESIENILVSINKIEIFNREPQTITLSTKIPNVKLTNKTLKAIRFLKFKNWEININGAVL